MTMNTTNKKIKEKEERLLSFKQEIEGLRNIADAEEYARQLAHLFLYGLWMGHPTRLFGTYHYDTNEWSANGLISNITHWMSLPQPPRKEE